MSIFLYSKLYKIELKIWVHGELCSQWIIFFKVKNTAFDFLLDMTKYVV